MNTADVYTFTDSRSTLNCHSIIDVNVNDWKWTQGSFLQAVGFTGEQKDLIFDVVVMEMATKILTVVVFVNDGLAVLAQEVIIC